MTMTTEQVITPKLIDVIFGWSLEDVKNTDLYKVAQIPKTFTSDVHYLSSFKTPLIVETHADLRSNMMSVHTSPAHEISHLERSRGFEIRENLLYSVELKKEQNPDMNLMLVI